MLVLTRKLQEQIVIGDNIKVTILRVKGNTVRLGIEAPRQVRVVRAELPPQENTPEPHMNSESKRSGDSPLPGSAPCSGPLAAYLVSLVAHAS